MSEQCEQLAREETKISNTGVLSFDLEYCKPPECDLFTVEFRNCELSFGQVQERRPPSVPALRSGISLDIESLSRTYWPAVALFIAAILFLFADFLVRRQPPPRKDEEKES